MLHETSTPLQAAPRPQTSRPVAGGEAWLMPRQPGSFPWVTLTPEPRVTDRRRKTA